MLCDNNSLEEKASKNLERNSDIFCAQLVNRISKPMQLIKCQNALRSFGNNKSPPKLARAGLYFSICEKIGLKVRWPVKSANRSAVAACQSLKLLGFTTGSIRSNPRDSISSGTIIVQKLRERWTLCTRSKRCSDDSVQHLTFIYIYLTSNIFS